MRIIKLGNDPTLDFAAEELAKYLDEMLVPIQNTTIFTGNVDGREGEPSIHLGCFEQLDTVEDPLLKGLEDVENKAYDDAIYINIKEGRGTIAGINPRSVLLAVYRFLTEIGCRWVRPGKAGEYIPEVHIADLNSYIAEKPSYRHRGICIEGANSYENIRDIIDWAPKVGFNSYFFQFREAYTFFERWYSHVNNPYKEPEPFSVEQARDHVAMATEELKKRGMIHHAIGHGWTCEPLGIPGLEWEAQDYDLTPEIENMLAEVNGKREIWKGVSLNTNLCYSNDQVRKLMNQAIVDYLKDHPDVDALHFWLADGSNNQCECENCRKAIPSDFYVMTLNELDDMLTEEGIDTKIVFLIYVDLLWPPKQQRIKNHERFIMMFAPITRTYNSAFDTDEPLSPVPPYRRNQCEFPSTVEGNLSFLNGWQRIFRGDSFDFDYHFMWAHYRDPGYYRIAQVLHRDLQNLKDIGLMGFMSCQTQRAFFPTGLGMYIMGKTLWNRELDFETIAEEYFQGAFGQDGVLASEYLAHLSQLFQPLFFRDESELDDIELYNNLSEIRETINDFQPLIGKNMEQENQCIRTSWEHLKVHQDICIGLARIFEARLKGDGAQVNQSWNEIKAMVQQMEDELQTVLDVYLFIHTLEPIGSLPGES